MRSMAIACILNIGKEGNDMVGLHGYKCPNNFAQHTLTVSSPNQSHKERSWMKTGCLVLWIEWAGSHQSPVANLCLQENCTVEYTGFFHYLITLPDGQMIVQCDDDYGFGIIGGTLVDSKDKRNQCNWTMIEVFSGDGGGLTSNQLRMD